jgi:hypothetical protein
MTFLGHESREEYIDHYWGGTGDNDFKTAYEFEPLTAATGGTTIEPYGATKKSGIRESLEERERRVKIESVVDLEKYKEELDRETIALKSTVSELIQTTSSLEKKKLKLMADCDNLSEERMKINNMFNRFEIMDFEE